MSYIAKKIEVRNQDSRDKMKKQKCYCEQEKGAYHSLCLAKNLKHNAQNHSSKFKIRKKESRSKISMWYMHLVKVGRNRRQKPNSYLVNRISYV